MKQGRRRIAAGRSTGTGELRVIGGVWRSRRIRFPQSTQLRPTPDRLRETLFDWLGDWIVGRRVLDLFAGSGALGIEALSRGAAEAVFVERDTVAIRALEENLERLGTERARVASAEVSSWLDGAGGTFDLVFLDPPYASGTASDLLAKLAQADLLAPDHRVYLERGVGEAGAPPDGWEELRQSCSGRACGQLLRRRGQDDGNPGFA